MQLVVSDFTLNLGRHELLDLFDEVVAPAFFGGYQRETSAGRYFLHKPELRLLDPGDELSLAIVGRLVKDTHLSRTYVATGSKEIAEARDSWPTAPTSTFALMLDRHWLLYVRGRDTGAPSLSEFKTALRSFLVQARKVYIETQTASQPYRERKDFRTRLSESIGLPLLDVTPVPVLARLFQLIDKIERLQSFEVLLSHTNAGLDFGDFVKVTRKLGNTMDAKKVRVTATNSTDGLDKEEVKEIVKSPAASSNVRIKLKGKDEAGQAVKIENEHVQATAPIEEIPPDNAGAAKAMRTGYNGLINAGTLPPPAPPPKVIDDLKGIKKRYKAKG